MTVALRHEYLIADVVALLQQAGVTVRPLPDGEGAAQRMLLAGEADIFITSPFDFAASTGTVDLALVPGISVTLNRSPGLMLLAFNGGLGEISTMAIKPNTHSEAMAASILLAEKYDQAPTRVECSPNSSPAAMLTVADCALLVGNEAVELPTTFTRTMELADEWVDTNETPLPYLVAWGRVGGVSEVELAVLAEAWREGIASVTARAAAADAPPRAMQLVEAMLRDDITTDFGPDTTSALEAYFRLPFYHSLTVEIPTIKFLPDGELAAPDNSAPASSNS